MTISIAEGIRSITELKRDTSAILSQLHATGRPVVLTVNGKAEAVLMDVAEFEKTTRALNLLKLLIPAEEDVKEGRLGEAAAFSRSSGVTRTYKVLLARQAKSVAGFLLLSLRFHRNATGPTFWSELQCCTNLIVTWDISGFPGSNRRESRRISRHLFV